MNKQFENNSNNKNIDFLLLMEDYQRSYTKAIKKDPKVSSLNYQDCSQALFGKQIYYGDTYLKAFSNQGYDTQQIVPTCLPLQYKWAEENGVWVPPEWSNKSSLQWYWRRFLKSDPEPWSIHKILTEQIKQLKPQFLWIFSGVPVSTKQLKEWREYAKHIILWWACPLDRQMPYRHFDLILSGIPNLAKYFNIRGFNAVHMPHAFDERILEKVSLPTEKIHKVGFIGSLSASHLERILFLDQLSRQVDIDFYGSGSKLLSKDNPLRQNYYHPVWGEELYKTYASYLMVIHKNIGIAGRSFSAKRLFEATGMGTCVVTEASDDHRELFKPDEEIVTFSCLEECVEKIKYLLDNPQKAIEIGKKAQQRTLSEHTYANRVQELTSHLKEFGLWDMS